MEAIKLKVESWKKFFVIISIFVILRKSEGIKNDPLGAPDLIPVWSYKQVKQSHISCLHKISII